jgi:hypothetical protein
MQPFSIGTDEEIASGLIRSVLLNEQAAVYGSRDATLTPEIFRRVLNIKLHEHKQRMNFERESSNEEPTS